MKVFNLCKICVSITVNTKYDAKRGVEKRVISFPPYLPDDTCQMYLPVTDKQMLFPKGSHKNSPKQMLIMSFLRYEDVGEVTVYILEHSIVLMIS